jgi:hypothetical protein
MKLLTILDSRLRGNDMFFQSVTSLSVIPAKAGIQALIDNWSIPNKLIIPLFQYPIVPNEGHESNAIKNPLISINCRNPETSNHD